MKQDILSMTPDELTDEMTALDEKKFRAGQIFSWLHNKKASEFDEMTDLSKSLRVKLDERFDLYKAKIIDVKISLKDNTQKYLLELPNNTIIESVLMKYDYGYTVCVSSQAGCKMGCAFCASGMGRFQRDLTPGEMLLQIYTIEKNIGRRVDRTVVMGSGEPFDNFDTTIKFIRILNSEKGHNMGIRNITVSTCGITPKINKFADMNLQVNLAVSLHAPNDSIRKRIMPIANKYPIEQLIEACSNYTDKTKRRITFEYALIDGVNDEPHYAAELSSVLKGMLCHVNIIPLNEVPGLEVKTSRKAEEFLRVLRKEGINATVRRKLGDDIKGACGQLRNHYFDGI